MGLESDCKSQSNARIGLASASTGISLKTELTEVCLEPRSMGKNNRLSMWVRESTGVGLHSESTGAWDHREQSEVWGLTGTEVSMQPGSTGPSLEAKCVSTGLKLGPKEVE